MRSAYRQAAALLMVMSAPVAATAQPAPPPCAASALLAGALGPWSAPVDRSAAPDPAHLPRALLVVGQALRVPLLPESAVTFAAPPGKPAVPDSHAGLLQLTIAAGGIYRIALGSPGWIDLVHDGAPIPSTAHAHGPACSGIHKIVDFALQSGRYTVQISADPEVRTIVLVTRVP